MTRGIFHSVSPLTSAGVPTLASHRLRRGAARATKLLQCQPTLGARAPRLGPCIVELPLAALASDRRGTREAVLGVYCSPPILRCERRDPLAGQPPPPFHARARSNRSAVEPTSRSARSRQRSNPLEASTHASEDTLVLSPVRATPTPSSPTRDPRRRATSVICEPIQASAAPKGSLRCPERQLVTGCLPPPTCFQPEPSTPPIPSHRRVDERDEQRHHDLAVTTSSPRTHDGAPLGSGARYPRVFRSRELRSPGHRSVSIASAIRKPGFVFRDLRRAIYSPRRSVQEEKVPQRLFFSPQFSHSQSPAHFTGLFRAFPQVFPRSRAIVPARGGRAISIPF